MTLNGTFSPQVFQKGTLRAEGSVSELLQSHSSENTYEVGANDPKALEQTLGKMSGVEVVGAGQAGRIRIVLEGTTPAELNKQLLESGCMVSALVPQTTSLEDVFMEVITIDF